MAKRKVYALSKGIVLDCEGIYKDLMNAKYIKQGYRIRIIHLLV